MRIAKVPLEVISQELIAAACVQPKAVLTAEIAGMSYDGGPCCAIVPLLVPWQIESR